MPATSKKSAPVASPAKAAAKTGATASAKASVRHKQKKATMFRRAGIRHLIGRAGYARISSDSVTRVGELADQAAYYILRGAISRALCDKRITLSRKDVLATIDTIPI